MQVLLEICVLDNLMQVDLASNFLGSQEEQLVAEQHRVES